MDNTEWDVFWDAAYLGVREQSSFIQQVHNRSKCLMSGRLEHADSLGCQATYTDSPHLEAGAQVSS